MEQEKKKQDINQESPGSIGPEEHRKDQNKGQDVPKQSGERPLKGDIGKVY